MDKSTHDFDTWFETVACVVLEKTGVEFRDEDSVRFEYEEGKSAFDVADEITAEYGD